MLTCYIHSVPVFTWNDRRGTYWLSEGKKCNTMYTLCTNLLKNKHTLLEEQGKHHGCLYEVFAISYVVFIKHKTFPLQYLVRSVTYCRSDKREQKCK